MINTRSLRPRRDEEYCDEDPVYECIVEWCKNKTYGHLAYIDCTYV